MIVVVAGIASQNGKIMLCRRKPGGPHGLMWEFPGGKVEPGESPEQALERELREELAIETHTGRIWDVKYHAADGRELLILFYRTEILSGAPRPVDCSAVEWVEPRNLTLYELAPSDAAVAARLAADF